MAEAVDLRGAFDLKPEDALTYFRGKGYKISRDWTDVWQTGHARYFTVAKIARRDLLETVRRSLDSALADGQTFESWKRNIIPELEKAGWWGRVADPAITGTADAVYITPRRLKVIYDTNLRTARAAGQWSRIQQAKANRPYLRYSAVLDRRTRPAHRAWHGTILPVDHPWWTDHFPPNGWFCRCTVQQLSERDMKRLGYSVTPPPDDGPATLYVSQKGFRAEVPAGIDAGFAHNPGQDFWRALTPTPGEPLSLPAIRPAGAELPPMPPPRSLPADTLLPSSVTEADAIDAMLKEFGASADAPASFVDVIGEPLHISRDFFERADGSSKLASSMRKEALRIVAETLKAPDEIWWSWEPIKVDLKEPPTVIYRLRRRYLARFEVDGSALPIVVVMDIGKSDWTGITAFRAAGRGYIDRQRFGTLAYQRQ